MSSLGQPLTISVVLRPVVVPGAACGPGWCHSAKGRSCGKSQSPAAACSRGWVQHKLQDWGREQLLWRLRGLLYLNFPPSTQSCKHTYGHGGNT